MERQCSNCQHFSYGVPDALRQKWSSSNFGLHADGVCSLFFPRGYVGRTPPHPAMLAGHCFQWEEKSNQMELEGIK